MATTQEQPHGDGDDEMIILEEPSGASMYVTGDELGDVDPDHDPYENRCGSFAEASVSYPGDLSQGYAYSEENDRRDDPSATIRGKRLQGVCTTTTNAPNFCTVYRQKTVHDAKTAVRFFTTRYTPGSLIRNAVTGSVEPVRVGSADERTYFKVGLSTGELGTDPYGRHLYYDSPDQYERHFGVRLAAGVVETWHANQA